MKEFKFTVTIKLSDDSGTVDQYLELRDNLLHLIKREDEAGNLLDNISGFKVETESIYLTLLYERQQRYFEAIKAGKSEQEATQIAISEVSKYLSPSSTPNEKA